ncbi:MAG: pentapeptide repeat-containing protein [bacterium]|nr:pentapeptide repeat-containing protein [bacterium]
MADFLGDLAGRERVVRWAREVLDAGVSEIARNNALLLLDRLGEKVREPLRLVGQDFRGRDFSGQDLSGSDLSGTDLSAARLLGADLRQAQLEGSVLRRVKLVGDAEPLFTFPA